MKTKTEHTGRRLPYASGSFARESELLAQAQKTAAQGQNMRGQYSTLPWSFSGQAGDNWIMSKRVNGIKCKVAEVVSSDDLEFITTACNNYGSVKLQRDELLAAARDVEAHSFKNDVPDPMGQEFYIVDAKAMDKLCAAIAKAKGNQ